MDPERLQKTLDALVNQVGALTQAIKECQIPSSRVKEKAIRREIMDRVNQWLSINEVCNLPLTVKIQEQHEKVEESNVVESTDHINIVPKVTEVSIEDVGKASEVTCKELNIAPITSEVFSMSEEIPAAEKVFYELKDSDCFEVMTTVHLPNAIVQHLSLVQSIDFVIPQNDISFVVATRSFFKKTSLGLLSLLVEDPTVLSNIPELYKSNFDANSTESSFLQVGENDADSDDMLWRIFHRRRRKSMA